MFELPYDQLESNIEEISSAQKLVYIKNRNENDIALLLKYPTRKEKDLASIIYKKACMEAAKEGLPSLEEIKESIKNRNIVGSGIDTELEKLNRKLEGQKLILSKTTRVPARRDRVRSIIENIEKEILTLKLKKERIFEFTQERKALEEKFLYLTWCGSYDPFLDKRYWESYEDFSNEKDLVFHQNVFSRFMSYLNGLNQETIRYIARSNLWRIRYVIALKTGESLFGCPISDYSTDQLMLSYWSNYYQSIYEMLPDERPPDSIIEDDRALDAYMKDWDAEKNRENTASRSKKKNYGVSSAWDYNETLVMRSNDVYEDVQYSETLKERGAQRGKVAHTETSPGQRIKARKR